MNWENEIKTYLLFCKNQKNLSDKTVKAYRIDINQYYNFIKEKRL